MKKLLAILLACVLLTSVVFPATIMPRSGYYYGSTSVPSPGTWTSPKYEISTSETNVCLYASAQGGDVRVELYGVNSTSGSGTKVGSINTATESDLSVSRSYTYYYFKIVNNSGTKSKVTVNLYA